MPWPGTKVAPLYIYQERRSPSSSPPPRSIRRRCCRRSPLCLRPAAAPRLRLRADTPSCLCLRLCDAGPSPPRQRAPPLHAADASSRPSSCTLAAHAAPPQLLLAEHARAGPQLARATPPRRPRPRAPSSSRHPAPTAAVLEHRRRVPVAVSRGVLLAPDSPTPLHTLHPTPVGRGRRPAPGVLYFFYFFVCD
ncbi:hypothetical protein PVAP13_1KG180077 [Panicum virgatum]|uniref:Uncharacterized protein n=1 Tax=Panicum virgatum TaxID=38727 RepID=A0A8T0XDY8_PANVG|nr:hypothetical protein PVAP13_1KG180077 [Panicum virgatum]